MTSFKDWQVEQLKDSEFAVALNELEPGYQVARLRIRRGLTQAQLAEMVDVQEATIARLESGSHIPRLFLLKKIAEAMNARIEIRFIPNQIKGMKE